MTPTIEGSVLSINNTDSTKKNQRNYKGKFTAAIPWKLHIRGGMPSIDIIRSGMPIAENF